MPSAYGLDLASEAEKLAIAEIAEEDQREAIDAEKERIRERKARPLWHRVFPWKITIKRRI